jgi:hypothetical protein
MPQSILTCELQQETQYLEDFMTAHPGPPTEEELERLYPPLYTWDELKQMISTGLASGFRIFTI